MDHLNKFFAGLKGVRSAIEETGPSNPVLLPPPPVPRVVEQFRRETSRETVAEVSLHDRSLMYIIVVEARNCNCE